MKISVSHPLHGQGEVEGWRRGGRAALVRFEGSPLPVEVPRDSLRLEGESPEASAQVVPDALKERLEGTFERRQAQLTLEAMRLGVVPSANLDSYTVGRDRELTLVASDLERADDHGAVRAFTADYGVGKTHLLELIQQRALEAHFLVCRVVLDPRETAPSHPKRVYRAAMRSLRYPDRPAGAEEGLSHLFDKAIEDDALLARFGAGATKDAARQKGHLYLGAALAYWRSLRRANTEQLPRGVEAEGLEAWLETSRDLLMDWIEGHPTVSNQTIDRRLSKLHGRHPKIYSLLDFRPWSKIYGYLLSGVSALAKAVGYRGLVVLLDEAEFYGLLSSENRAFAQGLFQAWTLSAIGEAACPFGTDDLTMGGYGVQRGLPARYPDSKGLYLVFAMTPNPEGNRVLDLSVPPKALSSLFSLESEDYVELGVRVCEFYASAREDWDLPAAVVAPLGKVLQGLIRTGSVTNPRQAMKFIIEFLDVLRYHPTKIASVVRNLQATLL